MHKRSAFIPLLVVASFGALLVIFTAAQARAATGPGEQRSIDPRQDLSEDRHGLPTRIAEVADGLPVRITQINSSTVDYVLTPDLMPAVPVDICLGVTVDSPDLDYMDRFEVELPDTWAVNEVFIQPANGCSVSTIAGVDAGRMIYWQTDAPLPSSCGAWQNGSYTFCASITIPDCTGEPWILPWRIIGDGWGNPPHEVSGSADPIYCPSTGLYLWR